MEVESIGSFHIGGGPVTLSGLPPRRMRLTPSAPERAFPSDGEYETGQMYVQYVHLIRPRARYPLLLWHGGGMTGATWESKPDGGAGWQSFFLNAGHDVYVSDAMERGRAGWSRFPEIYTGEPHFRSKREAWELFRFGPDGSWDADPAARRAFPGQLFPVAVFDRFCKQMVPRWAGHEDATQAAYDALVRRVGPCVIMTHSQSGHFGFTAAAHAPDLVRAVIAVEPSGAPLGVKPSGAPLGVEPSGAPLGVEPSGAGPSGAPPDVDTVALRAIPHLFVLGDYIGQSPFWGGLMPAIEGYRDALTGSGGTADWLDLPARGIGGNSHFPMMDRNSDQVAGLIQDWMERHGLMAD